MRRMVYGAIGMMVLFSGGCLAKREPIDNLAIALQNLVKPAREEGAFGDDEGRSTQKDDFYTKYPDFDSRLDKLTKDLDKYDRLTKEQQAKLYQRVTDTFILAGGDLLRDVVSLSRDLATTILTEESVIAKLPLEKIVDLGYLSIYLIPKISSESYNQNMAKLYWIAKCLPLSKEKRAAVTSKGEKMCVKSGCLTKGECAAALLHYIAEVLDPWNKFFGEGIDVYGRHVDGLCDMIGEIAKSAGATVAEGNKLLAYFKKASLLLKQTVKSSRALSKAMKKMNKGK